MKSERNNSIDIFRYFCAWLIIIIHQHPLISYGEEINYISIEFLPRIAVPFFFVTSGYFLSFTANKGKDAINSYLKRLVITYSIWSIIYLIVDLFWLVRGKNLTADYFLELPVKYLFTGISEHLWFVPSLFYSSIIIILLKKTKLDRALLPLSIILFIVGCLGYSYYSIGNNIPLLNILYQSDHFTKIQRIVIFGLSFTSLGYSISKIKTNKTSNKSLIAITTVLFTLFLIEKYTVYKTDIGRSNLLTLFLYPFTIALFCMLLNNPLPQANKYGRLFRNAATFIYFSQIIAIQFVSHIVSNGIAQYFVIGIGTTFVAIVISKINNKYLNLLIA